MVAGLIALAPWAAAGRTLAEVWAGTALGFSAVLLLGVWRLERRPRPPAPAQWPALVLLRPCEGSEPGLLQNLRSSLSVAYPGPRRVLFLVPSVQDAAYGIARAACLHAAPGSAAVLVTAPGATHNRKVAQLEAGCAASREELLVIADSDVRLCGDDLTLLVSALLQPDGQRRAGAAFSAPAEIAPQTRWDRASAALVGGSAQNFRALYGLYHLYGGVPSMAGALCVLRRSALDAVGGFSAVRDRLGEDYEIARRLVGHGYAVALSPSPARCTDGGRDRRRAVSRVARWLTVVRAQRPLLLCSYPLFVAALPALLLLSVCVRSPLLWLFTAAGALLRARLGQLLRRSQGVRLGLLTALGEVLLAEGLLWLGLLRALGSRHVSWRGHRFRIARGGRMIARRAAQPDLGGSDGAGAGSDAAAAGSAAAGTIEVPNSAAPRAMASSGLGPDSGRATSASLTRRPTSGSCAPPPDSSTA